MEKIETIGTETPADQPDAFLAGWDNEPAAVGSSADQPGEGADEPAAVPAAEQTDAVPKEREGESPTPPPEVPVDGAPDGMNAKDTQQAPNLPQSWEIKHLDETMTISAGDDRIPSLLQKGLDYDRVRGKYDEAKPVVELFGALAKQAGMSTQDYARFIRAEAKKAQGMTEAEASRSIDLEDREAAVSAREAAEQQQAEEKSASESKIRNDLAEFGKAFPEAYEQAKSDPKAIPQSVWDDVKRGFSLTAAYSKYTVSQAEEKLAAAEKRAETAAANAKNEQRSTGSMKSAGNDGKNRDPFLEGWES